MSQDLIIQKYISEFDRLVKNNQKLLFEKPATEFTIRDCRANFKKALPVFLKHKEYKTSLYEKKPKNAMGATRFYMIKGVLDKFIEQRDKPKTVSKEELENIKLKQELEKMKKENITLKSNIKTLTFEKDREIKNLQEQVNRTDYAQTKKIWEQTTLKLKEENDAFKLQQSRIKEDMTDEEIMDNEELILYFYQKLQEVKKNNMGDSDSPYIDDSSDSNISMVVSEPKENISDDDENQVEIPTDEEDDNDDDEGTVEDEMEYILEIQQLKVCEQVANQTGLSFQEIVKNEMPKFYKKNITEEERFFEAVKNFRNP